MTHFPSHLSPVGRARAQESAPKCLLSMCCTSQVGPSLEAQMVKAPLKTSPVIFFSEISSP